MKLDEFLLRDNINGTNSFSDANDSIFGGHSQVNNVGDDQAGGLRYRRFDANDCRLSLHLNIEKSNKKIKSPEKKKSKVESYKPEEQKQISRTAAKILNSE